MSFASRGDVCGQCSFLCSSSSWAAGDSLISGRWVDPRAAVLGEPRELGTWAPLGAEGGSLGEKGLPDSPWAKWEEIRTWGSGAELGSLERELASVLSTHLMRGGPGYAGVGGLPPLHPGPLSPFPPPPPAPCLASPPHLLLPRLPSLILSPTAVSSGFGARGSDRLLWP